jgi:thiol-disulfide isomerase/thioredoxin
MLSGTFKPANLLKLLVVGLVAIAITACWSKLGGNQASTPSASPNISQPTPHRSAHAEMGWVLSDGKRTEIGDYQGKVLVLDFYATWCEPCRDSIPKLIALQKHYGPSGLEVVGLNVGGPDDRVSVPEFAHDLGITYPLGFPDKALVDSFLPDDYVIPRTLVFSRDGKLENTFEGYDASVGLELEKAINDQLGRE